MAKIGGEGNVVMIMMLLVVSIIIYYCMNTFITLHQCTFNLLFALFFYTVSQKTSPMFLAITRESIVGFS